MSFTRSTANDKKDNVNAYDGTYSSCDWGGVVRTLSKTFYVEKTGTYAMDINAVTDLTLGGASPVKFSVDGKSAVTMTNSNSTVSALSNPWTNVNGWTVKNIAYKSDLILDEGLHTIEFEFPKRSSGDVVIYAFDCITFTPFFPSELLAEGGLVEIENSAVKAEHRSNDAASGGVYIKYEGCEDKTVLVNITAETAGYYRLTIDASSAKLSDEMSYMALNINGSDLRYLLRGTNNHTAVFKTDSLGAKYPDDEYAICEITLNDAVYLKEGLNTIAIYIGVKEGTNKAYGALDILRFSPVITVTMGGNTFDVSDEVKDSDLSALKAYGAVYDTEGKLIAIDAEDFADNTAVIDVGNVSGRTAIYIWDKETLRPYYMRTIN